MPDVLRQRPRIAVADPILTRPLTLAILSLSSDTERDDIVRSRAEERRAGHRIERRACPGRCGMRWRGTTAKTVPGDQPGRAKDTGDRADRTAVRGRPMAQGIEVRHRRRVPAETAGRVQGRDWTAKSRTSQPARLCHRSWSYGVVVISPPGK